MQDKNSPFVTVRFAVSDGYRFVLLVSSPQQGSPGSVAPHRTAGGRTQVKMLVKCREPGRRRSARGVNLLPDGGCRGGREIPQRCPLDVVGLLLPPQRRGEGEIEREGSDGDRGEAGEEEQSHLYCLFGRAVVAIRVLSPPSPPLSPSSCPG